MTKTRPSADLVSELRSWVGFPKKELDLLLEQAATEIERLRSIIDTTRFHLVRGDHHVHGCVDQIIDAHERALKPRTP